MKKSNIFGKVAGVALAALAVLAVGTKSAFAWSSSQKKDFSRGLTRPYEK